MAQTIRLEALLSDFSNSLLSQYTNSSFSVFDYSVVPTVGFGDINLNQYITQTDFATIGGSTLTYLADSQILQYQNSTFNDVIVSTVSFGVPSVIQVITTNSIESTAIIAEPRFIYNNKIFLDGILFDVIDTPIQTYSSDVINDVIESTSKAIKSTLSFGTTTLRLVISADSVTTVNEFGAPQLNFTLYPNSLASTVGFGNDQLNMNIADVPFPSIESTLVIPNPTMVHVIRPLSINTTVNFGTSQFIDNIHRVLVFKDGNITKIGENDAGIVAGQIRINPASTVSNTASFGSADLPVSPEGFLSINIAGRDYKIPYYNT
jgi:hypothetical protein